jgi:predicted secreted hydrolase
MRRETRIETISAGSAKTLLLTMYRNFTKPLEDIAGSVFDGVASLLDYGEGPLVDAPTDGAVNLPDDLHSQAGVETEWWYYTGHCKTERGREFGFELVFFKRRTDRDRIGFFPMPALANPMYFAHFAISDITRQSFIYNHVRSFGMPLDTPVSYDTKSCDIRLGDWSLREVAGKHILHATLDDGTTFDAILEPTKPLVLNGDGGNGLAVKVGGASKHFSFTRMNALGRIDGEEFNGTAWMDREIGSWGAVGGWDWFSIQLDDNTELMLYQFADAEGGMKGPSTGTYVLPDGTCRYLTRDQFEIDTLSTWTSPNTGAVYPSRWRVTVPSLEIDLEVESLLPDQELDTRGTTMIVYWEGACRVTGRVGQRPVNGRAYVELVGYDRSHEQVGLTDFLFGKHLRQFAAPSRTTPE